MNQFCKIDNWNQLLDIIFNSNPNKSQNKGFWLYIFSLRKDILGYTAIGGAPYYIEFEMYGTEEEIATGHPKGLISYTVHPYLQSQGQAFHESALHVFDIQTDSKFHGLLQDYLARFEELARLNHKEFITLQPFSPSLIPLYQRHGFSDAYYAETKLLLKTVSPIPSN